MLSLFKLASNSIYTYLCHLNDLRSWIVWILIQKKLTIKLIKLFLAVTISSASNGPDQSKDKQALQPEDYLCYRLTGDMRVSGDEEDDHNDNDYVNLKIVSISLQRDSFSFLVRYQDHVSFCDQ